MNKAEFAQLIDAYADAKASGNKYLVQRMIADLEQALDELFPTANPPSEPDSVEISEEE
jgi:hypothetical protein